MWIMTKWGFYSIVEKQHGLYAVRARERGDLVRLLGQAQIDVPIQNTPQNDYQFRAHVDKEELGQIMMTLASSVDYPNFKAEIDRQPDQARKPYHEVWSILARAFRPLYADELTVPPEEEPGVPQFEQREVFDESVEEGELGEDGGT